MIMNFIRPFLVYAAALALACPALAQTPVDHTTENATKQPNISGVWRIENYKLYNTPRSERLLHTLDGSDPPMQDWARKLYLKRADDADAGRPYPSTTARCLPGGMPAMMFGAPFPFQIIQSPGQVTTVHEEQHAFRLIYLDQALPVDPDPTFMGYSVGHWEGDTLVVETIGLVDRTTMDFSGMPHTEQLKITERIRRVSPRQLEDILTFDDPGTFTKPWSTRRTYKLQDPGVRLGEFICENQRNPVDANGESGFVLSAPSLNPGDDIAAKPEKRRK
jgi:hypothetical protein